MLQPWSVRNRMLALAVGIAALAWLVGGIVTAQAARDVDARMRDARLRQLAETVAAFAAHELQERSPVDAPRPAGGDPFELDLGCRYQVWRGEQLVLRSPEAPVDVTLASTHATGFADHRLGAQRLRSYVLHDRAGVFEVQVAELLDGSPGLAVPGPWVAALMLASLAGVAVLAGALVVGALRPVVAAGRELRARSPQDLSPLPLTGAPREMRPLLEALNDLLQRTASRLSREHGFTALAAHELRTPLAALRMQAQVLAGEADPALRGQRTAALLASADRCDHLLEQLLVLARLGDDASAAEDVDLAALAEHTLDELAPELERRGVDVQLDLAVPVLRGHRFALQTLLRNLVANAAAHSPPGAAVRVTTRREGKRCVLDVDDSGPGIAPSDRARAFERFVRLPGHGAAGSGLGLSIVRQVADDHGATVTLLDSPLGGLRVEVSFPAVPARAGSRDRAP